MNDYELMRFIRNAARTANRHARECCGCGSCCQQSRGYAIGTPPKGYFAKMKQLAGRLGWHMFHSWEPRELAEGCDGATTGNYAPPEARRQMMIAPDLSPAREFAVTAHELAHAILRHPVDNQNEAMVEEYRRMMTGRRETFEHETAAHLASVGVCKAKGLKIGQPSICYLAQRVAGFRREISEDEVHAAFQAARMIRDSV